MHDPAYKLLFSRPRMVRDLLDGFAARGWSGALDFESLASLPASFVGRELQQRHGDLIWRLRFRDDRWLYLVLLLEFQSTVEPAMAVRILEYTALLYQRLVAHDVLREHGALPPVLPVVLYNGRRRWTAPVEVTNLLAAGSEALAPYQPSQRYYVLDVARVADADLPGGKPVCLRSSVWRRTRDAGGPARGVEGAVRPSAKTEGRRADAGVRDVAAPGAAACGPGCRRPGRTRWCSCGRRRRCWKRPCGNGRVNGSPRASSRAAAKSGRCCAVRRR